ncbi:MAG: hypothetical protein ACI8ZF_000414 [Candidatus Midichloriaceae bacterium]|jgi:hypothetical protein
MKLLETIEKIVDPKTEVEEVVDQKSNEIKATPTLLESLAIS